MNPIKELVSIVTPVHNSSQTMRNTIDSIRSQTFTNWELILVDDASSDDSVKIAAEYAALDKRIKPVTLTQNIGAAKARNVAIDNARGQYIAFLDSDDAWDNLKLEKQLSFMRENGYALTYTAYRTTKGRIIKALPELDYEHLIANNAIGCLTVMVDRRKTGDFSMPNLKKGEDHLTWLLIMKRGFKAYGLNEVLATYTVGNSGSLSGNKFKAAQRQWFNYRQVLGFNFFKSSIYFIKYVYYSLRKHGLKS